MVGNGMDGATDTVIEIVLRLRHGVGRGRVGPFGRRSSYEADKLADGKRRENSQSLPAALGGCLVEDGEHLGGKRSLVVFRVKAKQGSIDTVKIHLRLPAWDEGSETGGCGAGQLLHAIELAMELAPACRG